MVRRRVLIASGLAVAIVAALLIGVLVGRERDPGERAERTTTTTVASTTTTTEAPSTTTTSSAPEPVRTPQLQTNGDLLVQVDGHGAVFSGTTIGVSAEDLDARGAPAPQVPDVLAISDGLDLTAPDDLAGVFEVRLPLPEPPTADAVPVVVHVRDDGASVIEAGLYDPGSNEIIVGASAFSSRFGAWLSPQQWQEAVAGVGSVAQGVVTGTTDFVADFLTGRTDPPACRNDAPSWASHSTHELASVHVCLQSNTAEDGTERSEVLIKSNRRTAQFVQVPAGHDYLWMQYQPQVVRELLVAAAVGNSDSVLLLGGEQMSFGFRQPHLDVSYDALVYQNSFVGVVNQLGAMLGAVTEGEQLGTSLGVVACAADATTSGIGGIHGCVLTLLSDADMAVYSFDAVLRTGGMGVVERNEFLGLVRKGLDRLEPIAKKAAKALLVATAATNTWDAIWDNLAEGRLTVHFTGSSTTTGTSPGRPTTQDGPPPTPSGNCPEMAQGRWEGDWGDGAGRLYANLTVADGALTGDLAVTGSYVPGGRIEGVVECETVRFGRVDNSVEFEGVLSDDGQTLTGTFNAWSAPGESPPDSGVFTVSASGSPGD